MFLTLEDESGLAQVTVFPDAYQRMGVSIYTSPALIVVGVAMDTVQQIESQLIMRHYDGFSPKSGRIRGRPPDLGTCLFGLNLAIHPRRSGCGFGIGSIGSRWTRNRSIS